MLASLGAWSQSLLIELRAPDGWKLASKVCFNLVALVAGVLSALSLIRAGENEYRSEMLERGDKIQAGLLSDNERERLAALRRLQDYPFLFSIKGPSLQRWQTDPVSFSQRAILDHLDRFRALDVHSSRLARPAERLAPGDASNAGPDASKDARTDTKEERLTALHVLSSFGYLGWYRRDGTGDRVRALDSRLVDSLDFSWIDRDRSTTDLHFRDPLRTFIGIDLSDLALDDANFNCIDLARSRMTNARIERGVFVLARLSDSVLTRVRVTTSIFRGVDAVGIDLSGAQIENSDFSSGTVPRQGNLENMKGVTLQRECRSLGEGHVLASKITDLTGGKFREAWLSGVLFEEVRLNQAQFTQAHVNTTSFAGTQALGAVFSYSILDDVEFSNAQLRAAQFEEASLTNGRFAGADLSNSSFVSVRILDAATADQLLMAKSLSNANFGSASFAGRDIACDLVKRGAVMVSTPRLWQQAGRPPMRWREFASTTDLERTRGCATN